MVQNAGATFDIPTVRVGGIGIARLDRNATADLLIMEALRRRRRPSPPAFFTSANGQVLSLAARQAGVARALAQADLISADGQPLVFASQWLTVGPLPERVATTDLFHNVARRAVKSDISFYLLGATSDEITKTVTRMRALYPGLSIVGARDGYFSSQDEASIARAIARTRPDILWVGMGVPRELEFITRNRAHLAGVGVAKTSGGLFNFLSGTRSRAPALMQQAGLEWLYRAALEPRRLLWRYATTNVHATYLLLTDTGGDLRSSSADMR